MVHAEVRVRRELELRRLLRGEDGLAWVRLFWHLALSKADNAARDFAAHALTVAAFAVGSLWVLSLVEVVLSLVDNQGAADDAVGAAEVGEEVSVLVLGLAVETGLDLLDITNASVVDVLVGVAAVGTEWVIDLTRGLAAVLEIAELVDLHGVEAGSEAGELTDDGSQIVGLLSQLEGAARHRVAEEIELARGDDLSILLGRSLPIRVNGLDVVGLDIAGADGAAADPGEAVGVSVAIAAVGRARRVATIAVLLGLNGAGSKDESSGEGDLRKHFSFCNREIYN